MKLIFQLFCFLGGKKNKSKIKNLGIIKHIKTFKKEDDKNILFLMVSKSRFHEILILKLILKSFLQLLQ